MKLIKCKIQKDMQMVQMQCDENDYSTVLIGAADNHSSCAPPPGV